MALQYWAPLWWPWWRCSLATAIGKRAKSTSTWQWLTALGGWMARIMSCQMSLRATATTTPTLATTLCLSAPPIPHPLTRFQAVSSLSAPRHPSGQAEPMGVITMLLCPLTGSTDENPMTEAPATWTEVTAAAMATGMARDHSVIKVPPLERGWGQAFCP